MIIKFKVTASERLRSVFYRSYHRPNVCFKDYLHEKIEIVTTDLDYDACQLMFVFTEKGAKHSKHVFVDMVREIE